ncbi:50S ribosomal protein L1 [bacterium]|nr:50S ribosomal protein L1 [FCB group bacterium]MBL7191292.1 50S ribosomal protein L1 [bacterium]
MKRSKRFRSVHEKIEKSKEYDITEAFAIVKKLATAKFDESIDTAFSLGVDPRKSDQMVRGTVALPNGTGKKVTVLVLCKPDKEDEALAAGAEYAGLDDYIEKINGGWFDMDVVIAAPDVMAQVGKLGKLLGPRGLMPNPKTGTVTFEVGNAVKEVKAGRVDFRVDKTANVHLCIGKASFDADKLLENFEALLRTLLALKPSSAKGLYIKGITISSTMSPGIKIDKNSAIALVK